MDATTTTGWWTCSACGAEAELPDTDTRGCLVSCPDCTGEMSEQWRWDAAA
ncbi:MAG TPA: hypothetical protein VM367_06900 [Pseudonocardia sp.]|nr:hypothetical protein [Pseudonocardia sp.]